MQRAWANARRNMPEVATVSIRALIGCGFAFRSFAQDGRKPHCTSGIRRSPPRSRTTGTSAVGATLKSSGSGSKPPSRSGRRSFTALVTT